MVEEAEDSLKMSACGETTPPLLPAQQPKKKRNLPGMPDPDAEVVALSPKTLLATNRFVCEICGKGFQRDQNLQLHRRGHNLPWKLKQRSSKEPRKRVYVCPEPSCVHHNASRALGDLTGIKKHFSRKHGEKKWKCERCSKKYAVQSDWKAHMKTCGTREYKCDCGTLFSRRDSFITHREFCDVLAEESVRQQGNNNAMVMIKSVVASPPPPPLTPSTTVVSPGLSVQSSELAENPIGVALSSPVPAATPTTTSNSTNSGNSMISTIFASSSAMSQQPSSSFSSMMSTIPLHTRPVVLEPPPSLSLSSSLYLSNSNNNNPCPSSFYAHNHQSPVQPPAMSATALLQKAAQMGAAATSNASFLCSLGLPENNNGTGSVHQWDVVKQEHNSNVAAGQLGLGLHHSVDGMMGSSSIFGSKPTTLDFLGLGMGSSALLNSYGGGFHVGAAAVAAAAAAAEAFGGGVIGSSTSEETWDGSTAAERNEAA